MRRRQCRLPTMLFWVGTWHCRLLYIIPAQPELILQHFQERAGEPVPKQISSQTKLITQNN